MKNKLELKKITSTTDENFPKIWEIYCEAFPAEERRSWEGLQRVLPHPQFSLLAISDQTQLLGLAALWFFDTFVFGEHLAIATTFRNQGYGSVIIRQLLTSYQMPTVIEVEKPLTDIARRRIGLYERLGLRLNSHDYLQPPYHPGQPPLPLLLMSHPAPLSLTDFHKVRQTIYTTVYGCSGLP